MVLLSCSFVRVEFICQKKRKKSISDIKNRKLEQKINNDRFLVRFHNTAFDVIFVQVIVGMLGASSYNFENKGKYYLHLRFTEGQ